MIQVRRRAGAPGCLVRPRADGRNDGSPTMSAREHWDEVYRARAPEAVSWYRARLDTSLALIERAGLGPSAHVVDVGGGASTLVDDLVSRGVERVTVVDLSAVALERARARLGDAGGAASRVRWLVGDATTRLFDPASVDLWHDRAVLHFLTAPAARAAYVAALREAVRPGGFALVASFAPSGPERCSGLPVHRQSASELVATLGEGFELVAQAEEAHTTPGGARQDFVYVLCRRR